MAFDFNCFTTLCRMTRDPAQPKAFGERQVIRFGVAFTGERRKGADGQWTDSPCYMDCEAWQGQYGQKIVDAINKFGKKGLRVHISGSLKMEEWQDKNGGGKRRAIKMTVTSFIICDKAEDQGRGGSDRDSDGTGGGGYDQSSDAGSGGGYGGGDNNNNDPIPF